MSASSPATDSMDNSASFAGVGTAELSGSTEQLDAESDDPYVIHGVAIGEGDVTYGQTETKKYWPAETLENAATSLDGRPLVKNHTNNADGRIGTVTEAEYQPGVGVIYEAEIAPHYEELARDVASGILEVSPRIYHRPPDKLEEHEQLGALVVDAAKFDNLSVVADGASPSNTAIFGESPKLSPDAGIVNAATASASGGGVEEGDFVSAVLSREVELPDGDDVAESLAVSSDDVADTTSQPAQMEDDNTESDDDPDVGEPTYSEGDWLSWEWNGGTATGRVENISTDRALSVGETTRDPMEEGEPVYKLKHWDDGSFGNMKVAYESNLSDASEPEAVEEMAESGPFQEMEGAPDFEHSPAWEDGQMVQWQVRPSLFGQIDHVDWERHVVMVDVHDTVDGELYSTGMTISGAFGDVEEYVPEDQNVAEDVEEMAKHGYEDSEYAEVPDGHIFETKADAEAKAEEMGIEGAHQMPNGMWMPGDTHEMYAGAVDEMAQELAGVVEELAGDGYPISWDDTMGGDLDESAIPNEGYEDHYVFAADIKSDSSYPLVDADGNLRRGNVEAAWGLRNDVEDKEMSLQSFEEMLLDLNGEFDNPPIDPSNAMEADPSEWMDNSEAEEASAGLPDPQLVIEELEETEGSMEELDEVYSEWNDHVNMSASQLESWSEHPCSDKASVDTEAVIDRNLELLETNKSDWTEDHISDAKRTNSFISRMSDSANEPEDPRDGPSGCPSEWAISLLNWAHNPFDSMPEVPEELQGESENAAGDPTVESDTDTDTVAGDVSQSTASTGSDSTDGVADADGATPSRPIAVASLASSGSATLSVATVDRASESTASASTMKELTYDSADDEALAELSEPVVVERDDLDDLHAEASGTAVEEELTDLNKTIEELSATTETLEDVDEASIEELRDADDPEIVESEELAEQRELVDEVTEIYAEELADSDQTPLTVEQLAEKFSPTELKEMYDETVEAELASGGIEADDEPEPEGGSVEAEELESGDGTEASEDDAREVVAEELRSSGWYSQADKIENGDLPVEPYLEE